MSEKVLFEMRYDEATRQYVVTEAEEWRVYHHKHRGHFKVRFKRTHRKEAVQHALESLQQMYDDLYGQQAHAS